jgi:hypothetical protein
MDPNVRRDLPLHRQLHHVHGRFVTARSARPAFQRRFKFPDRRIARTPDRVERQARAGFAVVAFDFEPAISAVSP